MGSKDPDKHYNLSAYQYGLAGAITGTMTRFLVQPLDVLKISFQLQTTPRKMKEEAKYTSIFQALRVIAQEEGVYGLWKGHIPAQFLSIVFGAVQFSCFEKLSSYLTNSHPMHFTVSEHFISIGCGSAAGLAATVTSFPFDIVKTHLVFQKEPKVYKGTLDAMKKIYRKEGLRGFSKGLLAACVQTTPMSGLVFCFHGIFTQFWFLFFQEVDSEGPVVISTTGSMTSGLFAGLCAKTFVYPFDLMKKRLQIQSYEGSHDSNINMIRCKKISECFILTVRNEGLSGLFKGFAPTIIKSGATTSLYFTIYDKVCQTLHYLSTNR